MAKPTYSIKFAFTSATIQKFQALPKLMEKGTRSICTYLTFHVFKNLSIFCRSPLTLSVIYYKEAYGTFNKSLNYRDGVVMQTFQFDFVRTYS